MNLNPPPTRLRRREVLGSAAIGAGMLLVPPAAVARAPAGGRVFSRRLGMLAGTSSPIETARGFVLAGVQWAAPASARIELRARVPDGRWSPWAPAAVRGHEPDRGGSGDGALFGEPLWFGPSVAVQVRSPVPVRGVRLHFVAADPATEHAAARRRPRLTPAPLPLAQPILPAGPGQPPIIARSVWAGRGRRPASGPYYGAIELAFVHHTVSPNGYSPGQVPAMILAIYDYHRYTRGYFDIAYNFVIDAFGRVWEARAGGIDQPVIGAHAGGYNAVSTGIAVLGSFMFSLPPPPALSALEQLLAWKLSLHGVTTGGRVGVRVARYDAFYTPFAPGQLVRLPRIAGHRDGDLTDCPGNDLYHRLPSVRTHARRLAGSPPQLTLRASRTAVGLSEPVGLSGRLTDGTGAPVAGAALQLQTIAGVGVTTTIATVTTAADGSWSASITPLRSVTLRALRADAPAVVSDLVLVALIPTLTLALVSSSPLRVSGTINPATRRVTITVYRVSAARHRRLVLRRQVAVRRGRFQARLSLGRRARGSFEIVARAAADQQSAAGSSPPLNVTLL